MKLVTGTFVCCLLCFKNQLTVSLSDDYWLMMIYSGTIKGKYSQMEVQNCVDTVKKEIFRY